MEIGSEMMMSNDKSLNIWLSIEETELGRELGKA
jgi:hypothetical protein